MINKAPVSPFVTPTTPTTPTTLHRTPTPTPPPRMLFDAHTVTIVAEVSCCVPFPPPSPPSPFLLLVVLTGAGCCCSVQYANRIATECKHESIWHMSKACALVHEELLCFTGLVQRTRVLPFRFPDDAHLSTGIAKDDPKVHRAICAVAALVQLFHEHKINAHMSSIAAGAMVIFEWSAQEVYGLRSAIAMSTILLRNFGRFPLNPDEGNHTADMYGLCMACMFYMRDTFHAIRTSARNYLETPVKKTQQQQWRNLSQPFMETILRLANNGFVAYMELACDVLICSSSSQGVSLEKYSESLSNLYAKYVHGMKQIIASSALRNDPKLLIHELAAEATTTTTTENKSDDDEEEVEDDNKMITTTTVAATGGGGGGNIPHSARQVLWPSVRGFAPVVHPCAVGAAEAAVERRSNFDVRLAAAATRRRTEALAHEAVKLEDAQKAIRLQQAKILDKLQQISGNFETAHADMKEISGLLYPKNNKKEGGGEKRKHSSMSHITVEGDYKRLQASYFVEENKLKRLRLAVQDLKQRTDKLQERTDSIEEVASAIVSKASEVKAKAKNAAIAEEVQRREEIGVALETREITSKRQVEWPSYLEIDAKIDAVLNEIL